MFNVKIINWLCAMHCEMSQKNIKVNHFELVYLFAKRKGKPLSNCIIFCLFRYVSNI